MTTPARTLSLDAPDENPPAVSYDQLLSKYRLFRESNPVHTGRLVSIAGLPKGKDAYNPSGPFTFAGESWQWFRIESRDAQDAVAMAARKNEDGVYELDHNVPMLELEDPFVTIAGDTVVVGGVAIRKDEHDRVIGYRTIFYIGTSFDTLERYAEGPDGMKDIRLVPLTSGEDVGMLQVFTRPYFPIHGRMMGRIAVTTLSSLSELACERLAPEHTQWLHGLFEETEWGGVNDASDLGDGLTGVLAHVSKFDRDGKRHYAAAAFIFNRKERTYSPLQIIAERGDFPMGPVKIMPENLDRPEMHDDLADVLFSARLTPIDGTLRDAAMVTLTCGLSDAAVGELNIQNPFPEIIRTYFPKS